jgi:ATP-binding cassette subfamily B multidrug efflux pump
MEPSYFKDEKIKRTMTLKDIFWKMWPYLSRHPRKIVFVVTTVVLYVAVGRSLPLLFGYAIDEGIKKNHLTVIYWVAGIYLGFEMIRSLLSFCQSYFIQKLGNVTLFDLRQTLIRHVQLLPNSFFDKTPVGRTVTRITNDMAALGDLFAQGFTSFFVNGLEIASILIALCFISFPLTLLTLLVAPIIVWLSLKISRSLREVSQDAKKVLSSINSFTAESLNGMKVLQLFNKTGESRGAFKGMSFRYRDLQLKTVRMFALLWPLLEGFNVGTVATALFFGAYFRSSLDLSVGELSAFILLLQSFFPPFRVILERYSQMQNSLASADRVFEMLDEKIETTPEPTEKLRLNGQVTFLDLSFQYDTEAPRVLKNINLKIGRGESVALVGRTGSGKSTMIALLQKMYPIVAGDIRIDDISIRDINNQDLRSHIGVVQQDNFIFRGTIASNIRLDNPAISDETVQRAAELTGCLDILQKRRGGLNAVVEEGGANLSAGERQLIAFARVLAFNPDIFILDEATANIDSESELKIQQATDVITRNRTSIIIAHRLSTIKNCDKIVLLSHGEILETGSHHQLLQKNGAYAELYRSQFEHVQQRPDSAPESIISR